MHRLLVKVVVLLSLSLIFDAVTLFAAPAATGWVHIQVTVLGRQTAAVWLRPCCCWLRRYR